MDLDTNPQINSLRNWVIIGVAVLLVLLAIIFALCMICRTRSSRKKQFVRFICSLCYMANDQLIVKC